jgi:hypothetical protein
MDDFLIKIYEEGRTKQAGADMEHYLADLPVETLLKIAVDGPPLPELPDSAAGSRLDRKQKFIADYVNKGHLSEVPSRKDSGAASNVNFDSEGKQPESNADDALRFSGSNGQTKRAGVVGGVLGTAALGAGIGAATGKEGDRGRRALKGALIGGGISAGGHLGARAAMGQTAFKAYKKNPRALVERYVQGDPGTRKLMHRAGAVGIAGNIAGGIAGAKLAPKKKESGLTKECSATAQEKAKIAMRAINVTRGASPLMKHAAAVLAGKTIASLGK